MILLAIDSSAVTAGCAVLKDGQIIAERLEKSGLTHSQTLLPLVDEVLRGAGLTAEDVDNVAVSAGPGSFTGVRIGIATVKGIAFSCDLPCYPVSTLDTIAFGTHGITGYIAAVMDARRDQVYNALYRIDNGTPVRLTEDRAISIAELAEEIGKLDGDVWLCGDGAALCYDRLGSALPNVRLSPENIRYQSGRGAALAAAAGCAEPVSPKDLLPVYLRLPQAERELNNKKGLS